MARSMISTGYGYLVSKMRSLGSRLRILHFRMLGIKIGKRCFVAEGVMLSGNVTIGDDCNISADTCIGTAFNGEVRIADRCHIGKMNQIGSSGASVAIGPDCIFAPFVMITDGIHEFKDKSLIIKDAPVLAAPISIAGNVWLGESVMVMQGVSIGEGAVIGAKTLVKADVPDFSVAAGIPARVLYSRS